MTGKVRQGQLRSGQVRLSIQVKSGLVISEQAKTGQVKSEYMIPDHA